MVFDALKMKVHSKIYVLVTLMLFTIAVKTYLSEFELSVS